MDIKTVKENFGFYTKVVLMFSLILGLAFLYGYWSKFDVNIFPFLGLFDLIRFSAYPLLILYVPLLLLYWLVTELHFKVWLEDTVKVAGSYLKKNRVWYVKCGFLLFTLAYFIFVVWLGGYLHMVTLKLGIPVVSIIALFWSRNVIKKEVVNKDVQEFHRYGRGLLFLCLLPFASYDIGHHKAKMIVKNKEYSYIVSEQGSKESLLKFIGFINGHYFFIDKDNKKLLIDNHLEKIRLLHFLKKGEKDSPDIGFT